MVPSYRGIGMPYGDVLIVLDAEDWNQVGGKVKLVLSDEVPAQGTSNSTAIVGGMRNLSFVDEPVAGGMEVISLPVTVLQTLGENDVLPGGYVDTLDGRLEAICDGSEYYNEVVRVDEGG